MGFPPCFYSTTGSVARLELCLPLQGGGGVWELWFGLPLRDCSTLCTLWIAVIHVDYMYRCRAVLNGSVPWLREIAAFIAKKLPRRKRRVEIF